MEKVGSNDVRLLFIDFFKEKNHKYWHSSSVIPYKDNSILFCNAGMNQFKPIFLDSMENNSPLKDLNRVVNSQKCIRAGGKHNDLDDVGFDNYHHTFFEMLGCWSFGDYFKKEIITWVYDLFINKIGLPMERIYVTYYSGSKELKIDPDYEVRDLWLKLGIEETHVLPFDQENFWMMGETGPCGPCTEIHFDKRGWSKYDDFFLSESAVELVNGDTQDVIELGNLVFIQYNLNINKKLQMLPKKHVDIGLGLERLTAVMQRSDSNYETDAFIPIFHKIQELTKCRNYQDLCGSDDVDSIDTAYRIIADHIRTLVIAVSDGCRPNNTGRGYVIRRIVRRAVRYFNEKLNGKPGQISSLVDVVVNLLCDAYPEIKSKVELVKQVIDTEEAQFLKTLKRGQRIFHNTVEKVKQDGKTEMSGKLAWKLYDTFGFPIDLTQNMAAECKLTVDMNQYNECMQKSKITSSRSSNKNVKMIDLNPALIGQLNKRSVEYTESFHKYNYSYDKDGEYIFEKPQAKIVAIVNESLELVDSVNNVVSFGDNYENSTYCGIILNRTNFYAEQGGQIGDIGMFCLINMSEKSSNPSDVEDDDTICFQVLDTQVNGNYILHVGQLMCSNLKVGYLVNLEVNFSRRKLIMNNHTATHLLNFAIREELPNSDQKGSLVAPDRLRFDYSHNSPLNEHQLSVIENSVRDTIKKQERVFTASDSSTRLQSMDGVRAIFGEVYPNPVRIVSVGIGLDEIIGSHENKTFLAKKHAVELCGGTHVLNTKDLIEFVIISEDSISSGVRRIVALTGENALSALEKAAEIEESIISSVKTMENYNLKNINEYISQLAQLDQIILDSTVGYIFRIKYRKFLNDKKVEMLKIQKKLSAEIKKYLLETSDSIEFTEKRTVLQSHPLRYICHFYDVIGNEKLLDMCLKIIKKKNSQVPILIGMKGINSTMARCSVPQKFGKQYNFNAEEWIDSISGRVHCKHNGKSIYDTHIKGIEYSKLYELCDFAEQYISDKLKLCTYSK